MKTSFGAILRSGTLMTWLSLTVRLGGLALMLPVLLTTLSPPEVLLWQMLASLTALVAAADFGVQPTFARFVAFLHGGGAPERLGLPPDKSLSDVIVTLWRLYWIVVPIAVAVLAGIGVLFLWSPTSALDVPEEGWVSLAFCLAGAGAIFLNGAAVSLLVGLGQVAKVRGIEATTSFLQLGATVLVAIATRSLVATVAAYSMFSFLLCATNYFLCRGLFRDYSRTGRFQRSVLAAVWAAAWRSGLGILMSLGVFQLLGLSLAQVAPATEAASYLLALRLVTAVSQISQAPFYSRLPRLGALQGSDDSSVAEIARRGMLFSHWTYALGAAGYLILIQPMLTLIGSEVTAPPHAFSLILALAFFLERYTAMHVQLYSLTNHIIWHKVNGMVGAIILAGYWALTPSIGAMAYPVAICLGYLVVGAWYAASRSLTAFQQSWWSFEWRAGIPPAAFLCATALVLQALQWQIQ